MPIDRVRNDGTVFRKKLNAKRPKGSGGPQPPVYGFLSFFASQLPVPAETVMGTPTVQRALWDAYVKPSATILDFEGIAPFTEFFNSSTLRNGIALSIPMPTDAAVPLYDPSIMCITLDVPDGLGRYNTTPAGVSYLENLATTDGITPADPLSVTRFEFSPSISCFGAYFTDVGDYVGTMSLKVYCDDGLTVHTQALSNGTETEGWLLFYGFVDTQKKYNKIEFFCSVGNTEGWGMDDIVYGPKTSLIGF